MRLPRPRFTVMVGPPGIGKTDRECGGDTDQVRLASGQKQNLDFAQVLPLIEPGRVIFGDEQISVGHALALR